MLARFLDHRLFKLLMLPARPGMRMINVATQPVLRAIGKVVGTEVLADAVAFFQGFAGMEAGFRQRADEVIALLRVPSTMFLLVAAPRREAVAEAAWFAGQLADQGIDHVAGVANRVHPQFGEGSAAVAAAAAAASRAAPRALWHNLAELRGGAKPRWRRSTSSSPCSPTPFVSRCRCWRRKQDQPERRRRQGIELCE